MGRKSKKNRPPEAPRTLAAPTCDWAPAVCGLLLVAVAMVFGQTVFHEFINYDDEVYVYQNRHVMPGVTLHGVAWCLTGVCSSNWHPLTMFSHMLDCQFFGLNAGGHHATSVAIHALNAILLFLVLRRITGDCPDFRPNENGTVPMSPASTLWPTALVAAVFAVHPLRVESVAWVAERKDVLSGLFFMLTLGAYVTYVRSPFSIFRYLLVVVFFALGLTAKPMLVTLPCVLLLLDFWPLGRMTAGRGFPTNMGRLVLEKIPLFILTAVSCVVTAWAQQNAVVSLKHEPLDMRITNALVSYATYIGQFFWPASLATPYPHPGDSLPIGKAAAALALLLAISTVVLIRWRRNPYLLVGWLWFLGMLVPVIGLMQVGTHAMADRYTYLPQIGLSIAVAWGAAQLCQGRPDRRRLSGILAAVILAMLAAAAWRQTAFWRNPESLWCHTLACVPRNATAHHNLGFHLAEKKQYDKAIAHYAAALRIQPDEHGCYNNLGNALVARGQVDEGIEAYRRSIQLDPTVADAYNNLGLALADRGQTAEAIAHYKQALERKPDFAEAYYNLANALVGQGQVEPALEAFEKSLAIRPDDPMTHNNYGNALAGRGRLDEAVRHLRRALELKPDSASYHYNLGLRLDQQGKIAEATRHWREAARLAPDHPMIVNHLAWVLATCRDPTIRDGTKAVELARRAMRLTGGREPAVLDTLAAAQAEADQFPEAVQTAQKAVQLALRRNQKGLANAIQARVRLYKAGAPFREPTRKP